MASRSIARADRLATPRALVRVAGLIGALLVCVPLHGLWRLFRLPSPWPRLFLGSAARICGARVRTTGTPLKRNVIYLSNHRSWLDILVIAGATGSAFVAKAELRAAPVVGWLATLNRTIFVARTDRMGIAAQIAELGAAIRQGWAVTIFPEGTTSGHDELLPFKGSLLAALEPPPPGVMVQPILLDYGAAGPLVAWVGDEPGQENALKILGHRGSFEVTVDFLAPFDPADHPGRKGIAAAAHREIRARLDERLADPSY
ncbi:lysophospholipid acyltransferase family protein [Hephaestia mangrovi]|uniref:lysophospholipid acyltransferase family protein n=1 Tax=Hephaestia mangrovi TaxID=2873268 RepID=UPI001CA743E5|nr:lysophospholipid acyltransferase family protein [Hephaestia mangrovi]MBY8828506.1 1-acyl-sn-glycerol-3-phosphate acyltransferase [Hephaestia mangrovi]